MLRSPLEEFLEGELNDSIREELLSAMEQLEIGRCYFEYNTFNVLLDADASAVTVEDELDVNRQSMLSFVEFKALLRPARER
jgi:hypothetical protein